MQHTECNLPVKMLEHMVALGSVTLNVACSEPLESTNGTPLVLLHGVTRQWRDYQGVLAELVPHGPVMALDQRGHGRSSQGHDHYRVPDFVDDAMTFLQSLQGRPVVLIGHSLGAMTAAMVAARMPGQVLALVMEDPPGSSLGENISESRYWLQFNGLRDLLRQPVMSPEVLARTLAELPVQHPHDGHIVRWSELRNAEALRFAAECLLAMDPAVLDDLVAGHWLEGLDWFGELAAIRCPTLLLRSDPACGGMLSEDEAQLIQSSIAGCERIDSPGHEHNLHATAPARYMELVSRFLVSIHPTL